MIKLEFWQNVGSFLNPHFRHQEPVFPQQLQIPDDLSLRHRLSCRLSDGLRQLWDWTLGVRAFGAQKYLCVLLKVDWPFYSRFKFALHPPLHFLRSIILASFRFHAQWKKMLRQWARVSLVFQIAQRSSVLKICVCSELFLDVVIFWDLSIIVVI